jgi:hypothetical protein
MAALKGDVPFSTVINLSRVFGEQTGAFVARYIRATHCDLFFADGAILVEGEAERILVPLFIRKHFEKLHRYYVTLMQLGGSHAHRLRSLIEHLGLTTLLITDVDPGEPEGHHKFTSPQRGANLVCNNPTLKEWHPGKNSYDELLALGTEEKAKLYPQQRFAICVAYQLPVVVTYPGGVDELEVLPATFEDSLVFSNLDAIGSLKDGGKLVTKVQEILNSRVTNKDRSKLISEAVRQANVKAAFALDLLMMKEGVGSLTIPAYIREGLAWLQSQLDNAQKVLLQAPVKSVTSGRRECEDASVASIAAVE